MVEGHPTPSYNGVYTHHDSREGWPVLRHSSGGWHIARTYFYRDVRTDTWCLSDVPHDTSSTAMIGARGELPVGSRTWECVVGDRWEARTLTVTLQ